jgi:predicted DCC family thiol-disulfide oxidoreductase YuxK
MQTERSAHTGGQYSLLRSALGLYLFVHFVHLLPWAAEIWSSSGMLPDGDSSPFLMLFPNLLALSDTSWVVTTLVASAALASIALAVGWHDRLAAIWIWYVLACLFGRNPLTLNPSLPFVGLLLLVHAVTPSAPFGSWRAWGRTDPAGTWFFPRPFFTMLWIVMAIAYTYSGWTKLASPSWIDGTALVEVLSNPLARPTPLRELVLMLPSPLLGAMTWGSLGLELAFAPLALIRPARRWLWLAMTVLHVGLFTLIDFADLTLGMLILHAFTFDPAWIRRVAADRPLLVLYDGTCGLCHHAVRFLLAEGAPEAFRFAALDSATARSRVSPAARADLPDSIAVVGPDGSLTTESAAVLTLGRALGGWWRLLVTAGVLCPRPARDAVYRAVARVRHRLFARPDQACPILPANLRERFDG